MTKKNPLPKNADHPPLEISELPYRNVINHMTEPTGATSHRLVHQFVHRLLVSAPLGRIVQTDKNCEMKIYQPVLFKLKL